MTKTPVVRRRVKRQPQDEADIGAFIEALHPVRPSWEGPYTYTDRYQDFSGVSRFVLYRSPMFNIAQPIKGQRTPIKAASSISPMCTSEGLCAFGSRTAGSGSQTGEHEPNGFCSPFLFVKKEKARCKKRI